MNTSFDITDIDCAPKELEDALGVSGRTLFDPTEHPIHVDIWNGKAYVTLTENDRARRRHTAPLPGYRLSGIAIGRLNG